MYPNGHDQRFKNPYRGEEKKYQIKELWDRHLEILRRLAVGQGNTEIALELGITAQTVSNVRNSPIAQEKLGVFHQVLDAETQDLQKRIQEFAPKALEYLERVIDGREEVPAAIRAKYADKHLERAGYGGIKKVARLSHHLTRADLEEIRRRSLQAAQDAGVTLEGEFEELEETG